MYFKTNLFTDVEIKCDINLLGFCSYTVEYVSYEFGHVDEGESILRMFLFLGSICFTFPISFFAASLFFPTAGPKGDLFFPGGSTVFILGVSD